MDPADALIVSKKSKLDTSASDEKEETSVFRLAGTVGDVDEETLLSKIRHHTVDRHAMRKHNPLAKLTVSAIHDRQREEAKMASTDHRFQFVSKLRHLDQNEPVAAEDSNNGKVQIYDVVLDGTPNQQAVHTSSVTDEQRRYTVTCNNETMIRERVTPHRPGSDSGDDHVYDLYYSDGQSTQDISTYDWSSLTVYEPEYVHDVIQSEDGEEDDDNDSNAEDNWRNDYPDEGEWEEEGEEPQSDDSDSDDDPNQAYRRREIPLMLDYDELRYGDDDNLCDNGNPMNNGHYYGNESDEERD